MTTSKLNPVITVPLSKGIQKHKPASTIDGPTSPQAAPPLPVRVGKYRLYWVIILGVHPLKIDGNEIS